MGYCEPVYLVDVKVSPERHSEDESHYRDVIDSRCSKVSPPDVACHTGFRRKQSDTKRVTASLTETCFRS